MTTQSSDPARNGHNPTLDAALAMMLRGWSVFPAHLDESGAKVPIGELVEHGFKEATLNPRRAKLWWRVRPDALIGAAMPRDTVAVDVDDPGLFAAAGLDLPDGPGQRTPRGGYHRFFKTDGRRVKQTVKQIPGTDTRVGGKGYVIAWEPQEFPAVADLPDAPEWLYAGAEDPEDDEARPSRGRVEVAQFKMGSRDNDLASFAGTMRRGGAGPDAIYAALKAMVANGQVEQTREDPITDRDLRRISGSIGTRQSDAVDKSKRPPPETHSAQDLRKKKFQDITYFVKGIMTEGFGLVGGAPKVGKSWLLLQLCLCVATGSEFLGRQTAHRDVLYYDLEDSERRLQTRIRQLIAETESQFNEDVDLSRLQVRYHAPRLTEGLEDDIDKWLDEHPGGLVVVDVLARVRPAAKRGSAYDDDYSILSPLNEICNARPGSGIAVVTHLRKAGAEDPFATFQGTMGTIGSADWSWRVERKRLEQVGSMIVIGRELEDTSLGIKLEEDGYWSVDQSALPGMPAPWNDTYKWVEQNGPKFAKDIAAALNEGRTTVQNRLGRMVEANVMLKTEHGYMVPAIPVNRSRSESRAPRTTTANPAEVAPPRDSVS